MNPPHPESYSKLGSVLDDPTYDGNVTRNFGSSLMIMLDEFINALTDFTDDMGLRMRLENPANVPNRFVVVKINDELVPVHALTAEGNYIVIHTIPIA